MKTFQKEYVAMLQRGMVEHEERFLGERKCSRSRTLLAPLQGAANAYEGC